MRTFHCDQCGNLLFFENTQCIHCGHQLGFLPDKMSLACLQSAGDNLWRSAKSSAGGVYRKCANGLQHKLCNWLVPAEDKHPFCASCRLNLIIPDLTIAGNLERWRKLEAAKRRVLYTLFSLGLPTEGDPAENRPPLRFKFLADEPNGKPVLTGHCNGEITVNIAEADADERERRRAGLHEPYRTLIGHFRHEVAHYYWDYLIADTVHLDRFRQVFGDESRDYDASLQVYYRQGPPLDWHKHFVSAYASAHPWEDWAETWAHYLHMVDTLETAANFGITICFQGAGQAVVASNPSGVARRQANFDEILKHWFPLTTAVNSLNRAMGLPDLYPFVLMDGAIEKMRLVHQIIQAPVPAKIKVKVAEPESVQMEAPEMLPVAAVA